MIIGENINGNSYYGYEEENYDYLFKRKSKEERQQKKTERKEKRTEKKQVRQEKRAEKKLVKQDPATGGKKKLQIFKNFGLFDKNKNKKATGTQATSGTAAKTSTPGSSSESSSGNESSSAIKLAATGAAAASALLDKTDSENSAGSESGARTEGANMEANTQDKGGKKEAGMGAIFGFVALGLVVTVIGVVLFRTGKAEQTAAQSLRAAA